MSARVTGLGVVSALGPDAAALLAGLRQGANACAVHEFKYLDGHTVRAPAYMAATPEAKGLIDPKKLRRMDRFCRMCAVAARQALATAGIDVARLDPARTGVVFGTAFGAMTTTQAFVDSWLKQGERHGSPLNFMNSVHGIVASQIALDLGVTGVNLTLSQRDLSFEAALVSALHALENGEADLLLVGGGDELTPLMHEFGARMRQVNLNPVTPGLDPFLPTHPTMPGDGAAVFVLEPDRGQRKAMARLEAAAIGRTAASAKTLARVAARANSGDLLVTTNRGGGRTAARLRDNADKTVDVVLGRARPKLTHRGAFGDFASAGALQFAANVLMLSGREVFAPMSRGRLRNELVAGLGPPQTILHDAAGISGSHACYLLTSEP